MQDALPIEFRHNKSFSIPSSSRSTPDDWANMASYATGLVVARYSIASAMGREPESDSASLSEAADRLLTSREASMFADWKSNASAALPRADWRRLHTSISGSPAARRRWAAFVPALGLLYDARAPLAPENCKAWADKYPNAMPLLVAARKMERAKYYAKCVGSSGSARMDFLELIACRKLMSEIGAQRIKASAKMKQINKYADEKEHDLLRRLSKLNVSDAPPPSSRDSVAKASEARDATYSKLTKTRTSRISDAAMVKRHNVELTALESALRVRIGAIEERLEASRRSGASSSRSSRR